MGNVVGTSDSAQPVILVNTSGFSISNPTVKVCEPEDAQPIILVNTSGNSI